MLTMRLPNAKKSFHTTMVLTQPTREEVCSRDLLVSIPLWFSRNQSEAKGKAKETKFPYHYGSHATRAAQLLAEAIDNVSIPLWFSRNPYIQDRKEVTPTFPYHYGSHATVEKPPKGKMLCFEFPYHYGSHATGTDEGKKNFPPPVSIPLWFSRNSGSRNRNPPDHTGFHTTMVLTQPYSKPRRSNPPDQFPYHYGSHATLSR